jgi:hypothetical protein
MVPEGVEGGGSGPTENDGGEVDGGGVAGVDVAGVVGGVDDESGGSPVSLTVGTVPAGGPSSPQPKKPKASGRATRAAATRRR